MKEVKIKESKWKSQNERIENESQNERIDNERSEYEWSENENVRSQWKNENEKSENERNATFYVVQRQYHQVPEAHTKKKDNFFKMKTARQYTKKRQITK